ncbi:hypothetical protein DERP_011400 [Dermatophagoides pteronyssinus]|uniref:Uncharacterized protein n=1 Tax=Dermatophagoides pteronyssinus TaxID=6956 RepID=A0ABQ8J538_DERPT|nr:hypothetical protein DERP_011400 [Dermatophagoides pteronyssinus]
MSTLIRFDCANLCKTKEVIEFSNIYSSSCSRESMMINSSPDCVGLDGGAGGGDCRCCCCCCIGISNSKGSKTKYSSDTLLDSVLLESDSVNISLYDTLPEYSCITAAFVLHGTGLERHATES